MAELTGKTIGELDTATGLYDSTLFAASSNSYSRKVTGRMVKDAPFALGTAINANDDLDNYTVPGVYYATLAVAPTLSNCPITSGFRLEVYSIAADDSGYRTQIIITNTSNTMLMRYIYGGTTYSWRKFLYDSILPLSVSNGGTGVTSRKELAVALGLAYDTGTATYTGGVFGYTTSATKVRIFIPVPRSTYFVNAATIDSITEASLRRADGGNIGGADATLTTYITATNIWGGSVVADIENGNWTLQANTPVTGYLKASITFT